MEKTVKNIALARISWNRLSKTIKYLSINENPKLKLLFHQDKHQKFIIAEMHVESNTHSSKDLQNRLQQITNHINAMYGSLIQ